MYLPPVMDDNALREAIAALLTDEPTKPANQDPAAPPVSSGDLSAPPAERSGPSAPQYGGSPAPSAEPASQPQATSQMFQTAGQTMWQPPFSAGSSSSPLIPPLFPSALPRQRKSGGLRYLPPMAAAFRRPVPPADLRRRIDHGRPGVPASSIGNLALGVGLFVALIIVGILVYNIIFGFLESISRFIP